MIRSIAPEEARRLVHEAGALLIDVRTPEEYAATRIPGASLQPLSVLRYLPADQHKDKPAIYFCHSGRRTAAAGDTLDARGHTETYHMEGGLAAWEKAGLPVEKTPGPPPVMRQVHMVAGSLVLVFSLLGQFRPAFSLVAALVGAGLLYSGLTGMCGMAMLLQRMPWNRQS